MYHTFTVREKKSRRKKTLVEYYRRKTYHDYIAAALNL